MQSPGAHAALDEETPPYLVDTHAHLHWPSLAADVSGVVSRARAAGVRRILTLATDPASCRAAIELAERYDGVYAAVGVHPGDVTEESIETIDDLAALLAHPRVVAIGETGLDYYHDDNPPRELQIAAFERHLAIAARTGKPICIHNREAGDDVMRILAAHAGQVTPVLHCYTGDLPTAQAALALGGYLSFAGNATYPKARDVLAVAAAIPAERLLLETDAPFLAPQPRRGRRNEPEYIVHTYDTVAAARGLTRAELGAAVGANAERLFGWQSEDAA